MIKPCFYCKNQIHWLYFDGKSRAFNDSLGSFRHTCDEFKNYRQSLQKQILDLKDTVEGLKNLIPKILSKIDKLENRGN